MRIAGFGPSATQTIRDAASLVARAAAAKSVTPAQMAARQMPLAEFMREAWRIVEPATPLVWGWPLQAICDHVQALMDGRLGKRNLLINVPPGSAKSTVVSVMASAWMFMRNPAWRAIYASGNGTVSTRDSMKARDIIESAWYRQRFGITWQLADDQNEKRLFKTTATGFRLATTCGAKVTGDRAHSLFVDDPLDAADAYSKPAREAILNWWDQAFANRTSDPKTGTRCVIMQRLHVEDLAGHILATDRDNWEVLVIPQEWEESRRTTTSLGWTDPRTVEGELMFADRFDAVSLAGERARLGSSGYAGQHQQRPSIAEGELFLRKHVQYWPKSKPLPAFAQVVISLDCAFKPGQTSDYSACVALAQSDAGVFVLDVWRKRAAYPQLKATAIELAQHYGVAAVLVEDAASGQSLIQDLQQSTALPVRPVKVDGDKLVRANIIIPTWEANRIWLPEGAAWLDDFLEELHAFPKAAHDDQVDAFVQGVRFLSQRHGAGLMDYYRALSAERASNCPPLAGIVTPIGTG